mgnify:CR=1 FL=1
MTQRVTGSIDTPNGKFSVELDNASSEATLARIEHLLNPKKTGSPADAMDKAFKGLTKTSKGLSTAQENQIKVTTRLSKSTDFMASNIKKSVENFADILDSGGDSFEFLKSTVSQVGQAFSSLLPGALGTLAGAISQTGELLVAQADLLVSNQQTLSDIGGGFAGQMIKFREAATAAGLSGNVFAEVLKDNADTIKLFGGSAEKGATKLSDAVSRIVSKGPGGIAGLNEQMRLMGYNAKGINEATVDYLGTLAVSNQRARIDRMSSREVAVETVKYAKDLRMLRELTGESVSDEQKRVEGLRNEASFRAAMTKLGPNVVKGLENTVGFAERFGGEAGGRFIREIIGYGRVVTQESGQFAQMFPGLASTLTESVNSMKSGNIAAGESSEEIARIASKNAIALQGDLNSTQQIALLSLTNVSNAAVDVVTGSFAPLSDLVTRLGQGGFDFSDIMAEQKKGLAGPDEVAIGLAKLSTTLDDMRVQLNTALTEIVRETLPLMSGMMEDAIGGFSKGVTKFVEELESGAGMLAAISRGIKEGTGHGAITQGAAAGVALLGPAIGTVGALWGAGKLLGVGKAGREAATTAKLAKDAHVRARLTGPRGAGKVASEIGGDAAKIVSKSLAKSLVKKLSIVGLLFGVGLAVGRAMDGDFKGAGMELGSSVLGLVPGAGTAAAFGVDGALLAMDLAAEKKRVAGGGLPDVPRQKHRTISQELDDDRTNPMTPNNEGVVFPISMEINQDQFSAIWQELSNIAKYTKESRNHLDSIAKQSG